MEIWQAIILGIIEGITEFLPVSSTGHLTVAEKLLGFTIDDPAVTGFTAFIQIGAIGAVFAYLWKDIARLASAWGRGLVRPAHRQDFDYKFAWYVIGGSIPIGVVGFLAKDIIKGPLRSLWVVAAALIIWSGVMFLAEYAATQTRSEKQLKFRDTLVIGLAQCLALIPGVSRSGATISVGLLRGIDRVTATRLSFFLSIPALTAAGLFELKDALSDTIGTVPLAIGTLVSFVVAYASVAWLIRYVAHHTLAAFAWYRIALGVLLVLAVAAGWLSAT